MESYKDPYAGMNFNPQPFDKEIAKVRDSFDATIAEAGMQSGMAAGTSGLNAGRVTADVYSRVASERDKSVGQLEGQKAAAQTQFDTQKQVMSAQAKAEWEKSQPGFLDWVSGGVQLATGIASMNPFGIFGGVSKTFGNIAKAGNMSYKPPGLSQNPVVPLADNLKWDGAKSLGLDFGEFSLYNKKKSTWNWNDPIKLGLNPD